MPKMVCKMHNAETAKHTRLVSRSLCDIDWYAAIEPWSCTMLPT